MFSFFNFSLLSIKIFSIYTNLQWDSKFYVTVELARKLKIKATKLKYIRQSSFFIFLIYFWFTKRDWEIDLTGPYDIF